MKGMAWGTLLKLVIGVLVIVGLVVLVTDTAKKTEAPLKEEAPKISMSGEFSRQYSYCAMKCDPLKKKACSTIPCEELKTCDPCPNPLPAGQKCENPKCSDIFYVYDTFTPSSASSGTGGAAPEVASFEGTFLPGGTVKIVLPASLKKEYNQDNFAVAITQGINILTENKVCFPCDGTASPKYTMKKDDKSTIPVTCGTAATNTCAFSSSNPDALTVTIPYARDPKTNIETAIQKDTPYIITLLHKEKAGGTDTYIIRGEKPFVWGCPLPEIYGNPGYEPEKDVVFNFSGGWADNSKYNGVTTTQVEIGRRVGTLVECAKPADPNPAVKPTCYVVPEGNNKDKAGAFLDYKFSMPYWLPSKPDEKLAISYPVYAKGITIKDGDKEIPMCRSGIEIEPWNCPERACYTDTEGKIGDKGKAYVVSTVDRDNGKYAVKVCKYSKVEDTCTAGCRAEVPVLGEDGKLLKAAECVLPKPEIYKIFMQTAAKGDTEYVFDPAIGDYKLNKDFVLAYDKYAGNKKWAVVVIKNNAPYVAGTDLSVMAEYISLQASLGEKSLSISPTPRVYLKEINAEGKTLYKDGKIVYQKNSDGSAKPGVGTSLEPGDYFEYDVDIVNVDGSDKQGTHTGTVLVNVDPKVKIASDSKLASSFTYAVLDKCCYSCDCSGTSELARELCIGTDKTKGQCGASAASPELNRCKWNPIEGKSAFCALNK